MKVRLRANVGADDASSEDGYNDEDDDNEDWVLWDEINYKFFMIPPVFHLDINYHETDKCLFLQANLCMLYFTANLF